jgi:nitroreductase
MTIRNETMQTLLKRRSIRAYNSEQITDDELETILEAGKYAPTGGGTQAWHFSVVQLRELLESINIVVKEMYLNSGIQRMVERANTDDFNAFYAAPTLILVSADESVIWSHIDAALAMGNMFIAAASLGIGSCWIHAMVRLFEGDESPPFCGELCIPEGYKVFASGVFGYPAEELPEPAPRREGTVDIIR